ncbi:unnamed protein product [Lactuca saligna]|uniref:WPP domain-containing protein n=1 Tax=Lactuca saligna TaxID=75948 RepID=A0AA36EIU0_LACSI|nr:unnamed protein product [Lactuca saligna]
MVNVATRLQILLIGALLFPRLLNHRLFAMDTAEQNCVRSIKLWPPSQNTRQVLVDRIIKNLTTPSILSRRYGVLSKEEAEEEAKQIESSAFATANQLFEKEQDGDGKSSVELYAKTSSTLMVEAIKRGPKSKEDQEPLFESITENDQTLFDISKGDRSFLDAEKTKQLLKPLQEPGNKYTKICFSNTSFGVDAARVAVPILSLVKHQLKEVNLSDFIAGRPEEEALEVMSMFSSALDGSDLRYLCLSENALGEKGVRAFSELLSSQNNLEELYLMNNGISEEAAKAVCELIPSTKKLKTLHFHNNMTGDEGAIAISELLKKSPILEDFRCSSTRVGSEGGVALSDAISKCTLLKKLDLRDNMFGVEAGLALSKAISVFSNLTEIHLSYLNLEDEGASVLVNALNNSGSPLEVVEMAGNDITVKSASSLAAFLISKRESLTKINLSENELKDEGSMVISKALEDEFPRLTEVDLSSNQIRRAGARVLAQAVVGKPGFKLLNINGNFLSDEGVEDVKEIFKNSPDLLGSLDENDPEGEEYNDEDGDGDDDDDELESRLKGLDIKQEE